MNDFSISAGGRAVGAIAVALLVVGAGAAIGMGTTHKGHAAGAGAPTTVPGTGGSAGGGAGSATTVAGSPGARSGATSTTAATPVSVVGHSGQSSGGTTSGTTLPGGSGRTSGSSGSSTTLAGSGPKGLPALGTYTYTTSGSQTLSVSGTTSYPPSTTIDVARDNCGVFAKWNSSPGNSTTVVQCPVTDGVHVVSETSSVTEGGYHNTMTFVCDANSFVPTSGIPGQTWTWSCRASNGETTRQVVKLIGPATMTVAGAPVQTEHVQVLSTLSGPQSGKVTSDYWLTPDALAVHEVGSISASQFGISYKAHYTLQLDSLTPS